MTAMIATHGAHSNAKAWVLTLSAPSAVDERGLSDVHVAYAGSWSKDGRKFSISDADLDAMILQVNKGGRQYKVDYEHLSHAKEATPEQRKAAGWITMLYRRGRDLFAKVKFTPIARKMVENEEYKFASIAFLPSDGKRPARFLDFALTNDPFLGAVGAIECTNGDTMADEDSDDENKPAELSAGDQFAADLAARLGMTADEVWAWLAESVDKIAGLAAGDGAGDPADPMTASNAGAGVDELRKQVVMLAADVGRLTKAHQANVLADAAAKVDARIAAGEILLSQRALAITTLTSDPATFSAAWPEGQKVAPIGVMQGSDTMDEKQRELVALTADQRKVYDQLMSGRDPKHHDKVLAFAKRGG